MTINVTNDELERRADSLDKEGYPHIILTEVYTMDSVSELLEINDYTLSRYTGFYEDDVISSKTVKSKCKSIKYRVLKR